MSSLLLKLPNIYYICVKKVNVCFPNMTLNIILLEEKQLIYVAKYSFWTYIINISPNSSQETILDCTDLREGNGKKTESEKAGLSHGMPF